MTPDKIGHIKAGALAAAFGGTLGAIPSAAFCLAVGIPPEIPSLLSGGTSSLMSAVTAGLTKEQADRLDNFIFPGMHEVSAWDAAATSAPGLLTAMVCYAAAYFLTGGFP